MAEPTVPRRLDPTPGERLGVVTSRMAPGSDQGQTRYAHQIQLPDVGPREIPSIAVVEHGDDDSLARPLAEVVMWVGAAVPVNAVEYDFYYPANVT